MLDFLYRSEAPRYKGTAVSPQPASGGLVSWFARLFGGGGAQPVYRQRDVTVPTTSPEVEAMPRVVATCGCVITPSNSLDDDDAPTAEIHIW